MRIGPGAAEIAAAPDGLHLYITHPAYGKITVLDKETLTARVPATWKLGGKQYVGVYSGIGGWIGLPVTAGLDLGDKFGAIGATAMTMAANLQLEPQGGELNVFRIFEQSLRFTKMDARCLTASGVLFRAVLVQRQVTQAKRDRCRSFCEGIDIICAHLVRRVRCTKTEIVLS